MNVYILWKNKLEKNVLNLLQNNNNLIYNYNRKNVFSQILEILKLKNKKDIQIILNIDYKDNILFKILKYILKIPILKLNIEKFKELEKQLQNEIAYTRQKDIPVLMYHRVISSEKEKGYYDTYVTKENFEKQMKYLKDNQYQTLTFEDVRNGKYVQRFDKNKKYVIITFDDGYKDNYINVLPILKKYQIKIVLFLITGLSYNKWDVCVTDRAKEKKFELMNLKEIKELVESNLVEFGGHTTKHLDMVCYDEKTLREDLKKSKEKLESIIGRKTVSFAYPWGRNNEKSRKLVEEVGYEFAVSTESGSSCFSDNLFEIQRVGIYSKDDMNKFKKKISGNYPFMREKRSKRKAIRNKIRKILGMKIK